MRRTSYADYPAVISYKAASVFHRLSQVTAAVRWCPLLSITNFGLALAILFSVACAPNPPEEWYARSLAPETSIADRVAINPGCVVKVTSMVTALTRSKPREVVARKEGGFVGVVPAGRIYLDFQPEPTEHEMFARPNTCYGSVFGLTYLWMDDSRPLMVTSSQWPIEALTLERRGEFTFLTVRDRRGEKETRLQMTPRIVYLADDFRIRFRVDGCDLRPIIRPHGLRYELMERIKETSSGISISQVTSPDFNCLKP
jgi:hypothetical protein